MTLHAACYWFAFLVELATCFELALHLRVARKLFFFSLFVFLCTCTMAILGTFYDGPANYPAFVATSRRLNYWSAGLQAAAILEAFWWLTTSLVNFRRNGVVIFASLSAAFVLVERITAKRSLTVLDDIAALERGIGISLGVTLLVGLLGFGLLGAPKAPKWHAVALVILSLGSMAGWLWRAEYVVLLAIITGFSTWLAKVDQAPTWTVLQPGKRDAGADEEFARVANEIKRKAAQA